MELGFASSKELCGSGLCHAHHSLRVGRIGQNMLREGFRIRRFILEGAKNGIEHGPQRCRAIVQSAPMDGEFPNGWYTPCKLPGWGVEEIRLLGSKNRGKAFLIRGQDFRSEPLDKKFANVGSPASGQDSRAQGKAVLPMHNSDAVFPGILRDQVPVLLPYFLIPTNRTYT